MRTALVVTILALLGWQAARVAGAALRGARDLPSLVALADRFPGNTAYAALVARVDMFEGRFLAATERLEHALGANPASAALWLDLARVAINRGDAPAAVRAAEAARRRAPTSADVCYQAGVLLLEARVVSRALPALRCAIELDPHRAPEVYALAWATIGDGALIRDAIVPDDATGWRGYAAYTRARRSDEAAAAWAGLAEHGATREDRFGYIEFLLRGGRGAEARALWEESFGRSQRNLVHNGSFEATPIGRGLGWTLAAGEGARAAVVTVPAAPDGRRALEVTFEGANVDYQAASQIVPVDAGRRYRLRATVRTEGLRSMSLPHLAVRGYGRCVMTEVGGQEWKGTRPWTQETLDFQVPAGCSVVLVQLRRRPALRFGGHISGRLWLDGVVLEPLSDKTV